MNKLKIGCSVTEKIIMIIDNQNNYSSRILRKLEATYAHGTKIFKTLIDHKIITKKKVGRKMYIRLTEKGNGIQDHLKEIRGLL